MLIFSVAAPTLWNSLPLEIRTADSVDIFKKALKTHLCVKAFILSSLSPLPFLLINLCSTIFSLLFDRFLCVPPTAPRSIVKRALVS